MSAVLMGHFSLTYVVTKCLGHWQMFADPDVYGGVVHMDKSKWLVLCSLRSGPWECWARFLV